MEKAKLNLRLIGVDNERRPVFQDENDKLWKDVNLGHDRAFNLFSVWGNSFDGEPDCPIKGEYTFNDIDILGSIDKLLQKIALCERVIETKPPSRSIQERYDKKDFEETLDYLRNMEIRFTEYYANPQTENEESNGEELEFE